MATPPSSNLVVTALEFTIALDNCKTAAQSTLRQICVEMCGSLQMIDGGVWRSPLRAPRSSY
jgi:hypothetical protein